MTEKKNELVINQFLRIDLGFAILVAEKSTDPTYPNEIIIGLEDKDGSYLQDIAVVGQRYHYNKDNELAFENELSVKVWADKDNEDYTHEFKIDVYKDEWQEYDLETLFENVKKQFEAMENTNVHGEPQAFISLENGRSIEITLEKEGLSEEDFFYSGRLHCTEEEFDNNAFPSTMGILNQECTENADINSVKDLIKALLLTDEYFPVKNTEEKE